MFLGLRGQGLNLLIPLQFLINVLSPEAIIVIVEIDGQVCQAFI